MDSSAGLCGTEDAVGVLLEYLVDPKLPQKSCSKILPSRHNQEAVAKQVHAVVLLYNYYYRKQNPRSELLSFESFCKLATIVRPTLLSYMKLMQLSSDTELNDVEQQLSLTERKIMEACNISSTLDASQNAPIIEGWPISKVSVFLVDSGMNFCWLKFGSVTEGVWSIIEKDINLINNNLKGSVESEPVERKKRFIRRPVKNVPDSDEASILHLAFSAVEETTGILRSNLLVLEKNAVYSTSKEKSACCFYIMKCTKPNKNDVINHPISDAIDSLQGPLFTRGSSHWFHTKVVEYFHLLPYASVLSDWAFRLKTIEKPILDEVPKKGTVKQEEESEDFKADPLNEDIEKPEADKCVSNHSKPASEDTNVRKEVQNGSANKGGTVDSLTRKGISQNGSISKLDSNGISSDENQTAIENHALVKYDPNGNDLNKAQTNNYGLQTTPVVRKLNGSVDKIGSTDSLKRKRISENESLTNPNSNGIASGQNQMTKHNQALVKYDPNKNDLKGVYAVLASKEQELSQAALKVVLNKRAKLCLQLRHIEDQIAECDKNIQILNGSEGDLALKMQFLGDLIQESAHQFSKGQPSTQLIECKKEPDLVANNLCQELDDVCCRNNWVLPKYCLSAQDGGFSANVIVKGMDFEYSGSGEICHNPKEARESAAARMLDKLSGSSGII